jgi:hypothetical protein
MQGNQKDESNSAIKELLFSGGAGAVSYQMGFAQGIL